MSNKTIRMSGARKIELQLHEASYGHNIVTTAIAGGFVHANKDYVNTYTVNDKPSEQKVAKNGLIMTQYSVGNRKTPQVSMTLEWTQSYLDMRKTEKSLNTRGSYIGLAGRAAITNPIITDAEGNEQVWDKGFVGTKKHKYSWQPHVEVGLLRYLSRLVTGSLSLANKKVLTYRQQQQIGMNVNQLKRALAYLKLDAALAHTEASVLVSKRASPYEHSHYIIRATTGRFDYGSDSDYSKFELLKLPRSASAAAINKMVRAIPLLENLREALNSTISLKNNGKYDESQLAQTTANLETYQTMLDNIIEKQVAEHGSIEDAIEVDTQRRAEIVEYLKAVPHKHLISTNTNNSRLWFGDDKNDPAPSFTTHNGLGIDIEKRKENIERTKASVLQYEAKVASNASGLSGLKMQVAVGELTVFAAGQGWIQPPVTAGDEE